MILRSVKITIGRKYLHVISAQYRLSVLFLFLRLKLDFAFNNQLDVLKNYWLQFYPNIISDSIQNFGQIVKFFLLYTLPQSKNAINCN